ncbi:MAG: hypothetical protein JXR03_18680 [Cyclobacteriaceae bacterium]
MNKLKKYNQIVFALMGTIMLGFLIVLGVKLLVDEFRVIDYPDNSLIAETELDSLKQLNLRNQVISLENIRPFDSATGTYLIPVYHKKLTNASPRYDKEFALLDVRSSAGEYYYGYGDYNNILLYNFASGDCQILLDERVSIDNYQIIESNKRLLIVFTGWDKDTNQDGKLNKEDFKQVFVYDHSNQKVNKIENTRYRIDTHQYLKDIDKLTFKATDARNDSIPLDELSEFLLLYSFENNDLTLLIDANTLSHLQNIIDN